MKFCKNNFLILTIVFFIVSLVFWAQSANFLIDFSRELTIPFQMSQNQKLFSDIFLIYGFWGYFVNFLLYKISPNIEILLFEDVFLSYLATLIFYYIAKRYTNSAIALGFTISFILCSVYSCATFSYSVPYSYSVLWAYLAGYILLYSVLAKKDMTTYLSLGLIFVAKIELFVPLFAFVIVYKLITKEKFSFKFLYIFLFPLILIAYLLIYNISPNDILNNLLFIKKMVSTQAIKYFYSGMGVFFSVDYFIYNLKNIILSISTFLLSYFLYKKNQKILSAIALILFFSIKEAVFLNNLAVFLLIALFLYNLKLKKITQNDIILFSFSLILSLKSLFALNIYGYGNFSFILVIFNIYILLSKFLVKNYLNIYFTIFLLYLSTNNIENLIKDKKLPYKTDKGNVFINQDKYESFVSLDKFIKSNIKNNENMVVLPEGQIFNYLNNKKWLFYNSTFTPLDFETFSDEYFIEQIKQNKTDYVIIYPRDTRDYKKKEICLDYGVDFCRFIVDNYSENDILKKYDIVIYKKKL